MSARVKAAIRQHAFTNRPGQAQTGPHRPPQPLRLPSDPTPSAQLGTPVSWPLHQGRRGTDPTSDSRAASWPSFELQARRVLMRRRLQSQQAVRKEAKVASDRCGPGRAGPRSLPWRPCPEAGCGPMSGHSLCGQAACHHGITRGLRAAPEMLKKKRCTAGGCPESQRPSPAPTGPQAPLLTLPALPEQDWPWWGPCLWSPCRVHTELLASGRRSCRRLSTTRPLGQAPF